MLPIDEPSRPEDIVVMPEVGAILQQTLDVNNHQRLKIQAAEAEAWQSRAAFEHRRNARFLAQLKKTYLTPKTDRSVTEMERVINLEARVRDLQYVTDLLKDYSELLSKRVLFCQSLMKSNGIEMKSGLR
jgi:hypothetical protein